MTVMSPPPARNQPHDPARANIRRGRASVVIVMIVALGLTALTRWWAVRARDRATQLSVVGASPVGGTNSSSLSSMPSYATALLLGGLRGPLVMVLWTSSESQKTAHELQDFDTKVEWIRLLQPEFDTVHLFEIWNKAYNISAQMASLSNKYTTILDAIDYGRKVDRERPDDINIISAIAAIYGDKLGNSTEHAYYRRRVRRETQTLIRVSFPAARVDEFRNQASTLGWTEDESPIYMNQRTNRAEVLLERPMVERLHSLFSGPDVTEQPQTLSSEHNGDPAWRLVRLDSMLDINGNVLPALLQPRVPPPPNLPPGEVAYDGSQLQFLKQYEPFPYGLSPLAIAYAYYKRAQLLQTQWNEHHIQSGDVVISSRPALELELWSKDEWERGRRYELRAVGHPAPLTADPMELELPTGAIATNEPITDPASMDAALYSYALAARLAADSRAEFRTHIRLYPDFVQTYLVHIDDMISEQQMMNADHDYLQAITQSGAQKDALLRKARQEYTGAMQHFGLTVLKYYTDDPIAARIFPIDPATHDRYTRLTIETAPPSVWLPTYNAVTAYAHRTYVDRTGQYNTTYDPHGDDCATYHTYLEHCQDRVRAITQELTPATRG